MRFCEQQKQFVNPGTNQHTCCHAGSSTPGTQVMCTSWLQSIHGQAAGCPSMHNVRERLSVRINASVECVELGRACGSLSERGGSRGGSRSQLMGTPRAWKLALEYEECRDVTVHWQHATLQWDCIVTLLVAM